MAEALSAPPEFFLHDEATLASSLAAFRRNLSPSPPPTPAAQKAAPGSPAGSARYPSAAPANPRPESAHRYSSRSNPFVWLPRPLSGTYHPLSPLHERRCLAPSCVGPARQR